jgi:hypothetical protein
VAGGAAIAQEQQAPGAPQGVAGLALQDICFAGLPAGLGGLDGASRHQFATVERDRPSLETLWC